jgi:hypothetical protein
MSNPLTPYVNVRPFIEGVFVKYKDSKFIARDGAILTEEMCFLGLGTLTAVQRFENGFPTVIWPDEKGLLPDPETLNETIPEEQWPDGLNGQKDAPYKYVHRVVLLNIADASTYTTCNSTVGQRIAVKRLEERVRNMRMLRGARVTPVIQLASAPMRTQWGERPRPEYRVVDWRIIDDGSTPAAIEHNPDPTSGGSGVAAAAAAAALPGTPVDPVSLAEEMNDSIPI